jgi:hypothetical protein
MREIQLTKGKVAIVDDDMFEYLNQFKWCYSKGYAIRGIRVNGKAEKICMHRAIINTPVGMDTDHMNMNKLDNRRENLRICNRSENIRNTGLRSTNSSGYKGVTLHKARNKWRARIRVNGKKKSLGYFATKEEAAKAYNAAASFYFREFAWLNIV